jgi:hypothetical protein
MMDAGRPALATLAVRGLTQVGNRLPFRVSVDPASDELPESEWRPTGLQRLACVEAAIRRLIGIARKGPPDLEEELLSSAKALSELLRAAPVRRLVTEFFEAVRDTYPGAREALRRDVADILRMERKYWKELPPAEIAELEDLHGRFEDPSFGARLRQFVGPSHWGPAEEPDLVPLATELLVDKTALEAEWPWLTSGEAGSAWQLGRVLAESDAEGKLESVLTGLPGRGPDLRVLCGYVCKRREFKGDGWFDSWTTTQLGRSPTDAQLLLELTWRCGVTVHTAHEVAAALRQYKIEPGLVGRLGFGPWGEELPTEVLAEVLQTMQGGGYEETSLIILRHRLKAKPSEIGEWSDLALKLVTSGDLIRSKQMVSHHWKEVAMKLVPQHARKIAAAIMREQAERNSRGWFAEHSMAGAVLNDCIEHDPKGVWEGLKPYLTSRGDAYWLSLGLPSGILERMPAKDVEDWIAENPKERVAMTARLVGRDFSNDTTLASRLIGLYGDIEGVAGAFFAAFFSSAWSGQASDHYNQRAEGLREIAGRTSLPKLRRWANDAAESFREMAEGERQREEEEDLQRRG